MKFLEKLAVILLVAGAINWGLVTVGFDLVSWLAGKTIMALDWIIKGAVGLAGVYTVLRWKKMNLMR